MYSFGIGSCSRNWGGSSGESGTCPPGVSFFCANTDFSAPVITANGVKEICNWFLTPGTWGKWHIPSPWPNHFLLQCLWTWNSRSFQDQWRVEISVYHSCCLRVRLPLFPRHQFWLLYWKQWYRDIVFGIAWFIVDFAVWRWPCSAPSVILSIR